MVSLNNLSKHYWCNHSDIADRPNFRYWLYKLHEIDGSPEQMSIRNDYMWFMLLMLQSKRIAEPFKNEPPQGELKPLRQILVNNSVCMFIDPDYFFTDTYQNY